MCRGNGNICILVISQGRCSSCNDNGEQSSPFPIPSWSVSRVCDTCITSIVRVLIGSI